jgi:hypothetical protein
MIHAGSRGLADCRVSAPCWSYPAEWVSGVGGSRFAIATLLSIGEGVIVADWKTKNILADAKLLEAHGLVGGSD